MKAVIFTLSSARKIVRLLDGESVPFSAFSASLAQALLDEGILAVAVRGSMKSFRMNNAKGCRLYLSQHYTFGMELEEWIEMKSREGDVSRSEQVAKAGHSKLRETRTFKGFLLKSEIRIGATLCGEPFVVHSAEGTALFMEDYVHFRIPEEVLVVGMENGENFQHVREQLYLFGTQKVLFVSRYPQSGDLREWLQLIPNRYLHFGDFDLAGIHLFQNEFYVHLGNRAEFFIPADIEERLQQGSTLLYDRQYSRYKLMEIKDERLLPIVEMIHRYRKGYEQEGYIHL